MPSHGRDDPGRFEALRKGRSADQVFEQLAASILRGRLRAGEPIPVERVLAEQFAVSRIIVRQALHRLADMGLLAVKQGGVSVALDPASSSDLRVIELRYRFGVTDASDARDLWERQVMLGHALVYTAARRATRRRLQAMEAWLGEYVPAPDDAARRRELEERFWTRLAEAGENRFYVFDCRWWYRLLADVPRARSDTGIPLAVSLAFLRELVRRLLADDDAARFYLTAVEALPHPHRVKARPRRPRAHKS